MRNEVGYRVSSDDDRVVPAPIATPSDRGQAAQGLDVPRLGSKIPYQASNSHTGKSQSIVLVRSLFVLLHYP